MKKIIEVNPSLLSHYKIITDRIEDGKLYWYTNISPNYTYDKNHAMFGGDITLVYTECGELIFYMGTR
jgi:hypothetical protein